MDLRKLVLFLGAVVVVAACKDKSGDGATGAVSYAKVTTSAPPGSVSTIVPKGPRTVCRAISATGHLTHEDDAGLAANDLVGESWVELAPGSKLAVKNGTTTREMLFDGPGAIRACVNGEEEMWVNGGVFTSVIGAGETPGAEVWVVTPHGVVRYGSGARVTMNVMVMRVDVKVEGGSAWMWPIDTNAWTEIGAGKTATLSTRKAPSQIVADCEQAAKAAHDLGVAIVTNDASLAEAAPQHVVLRQKAHAICAIAELVSNRSLDPVERGRLTPRAHTANSRWRDASGNP
ncbi:MAG TPA: hypothetical protein VGH87_10725 [Polyangiaceae bacterium]|jgi:hypothetical protein|nr:hypothetical protein [Polyangiaceae bacterium]